MVISDGYIDGLRIVDAEQEFYDVQWMTGGYGGQPWEDRLRVWRLPSTPPRQYGNVTLPGAKVLRFSFNGLYLQGGAHWATLVRKAIDKSLRTRVGRAREVTRIHLVAGRNDFTYPLSRFGSSKPEEVLERTIRGGISFIEELVGAYPWARVHYWGPGRLHPHLLPEQRRRLGPMAQLLEKVKLGLRPSFPHGRQARGRRVVARNMFASEEGVAELTNQDGTLSREGVGELAWTLLFESLH